MPYMITMVTMVDDLRRAGLLAAHPGDMMRFFHWRHVDSGNCQAGVEIPSLVLPVSLLAFINSHHLSIAMASALN